MRDGRLSRLLWEVRTRFDRQLLEEDAIGRYGMDTVAEARNLALVEVDEGTHWGFQRVVYLTRSGRRQAKAGRTIFVARRTWRTVEWLRAATGGVPVVARDRQ